MRTVSSSSGESVVNRNYDLARVQRIAIVDGGTTTYRLETRQALIDSFQMEFMRHGWSVIERVNLESDRSTQNRGSELLSGSGSDDDGLVVDLPFRTDLPTAGGGGPGPRSCRCRGVRRSLLSIGSVNGRHGVFGRLVSLGP